jgi:hypothetical protein
MNFSLLVFGQPDVPADEKMFAFSAESQFGQRPPVLERIARLEEF